MDKGLTSAAQYTLDLAHLGILRAQNENPILFNHIDILQQSGALPL
jgi:hypothetical protein